MAILERHADHLIPGPHRFVPRPVLGGEDVSVILAGKLSALIKSHFERGIVRLKQHVRHLNFIFQLGVLAQVTRVLVAADVVPGPAIKAALLDVRDVIGRKVVAKLVTLVDGRPELARLRVYRDSHRVADAPRVHAQAGAVGIRLKDVRPPGFYGIVVGIVGVRARPHRHEHPLAIEREREIACPVAAASQAPVARQFGNDDLLRAVCPQVAVLVRKADHGIRIGHIDVFRVGSGRIERDAEGQSETGSEDLGFSSLAIFAGAPQDLEASRLAFGYEQVAVRRGADLPGIVQSGRVLLYLESGRSLRPSVCRPRHQPGPVVNRNGCPRFREIGHRDLSEYARPLAVVVGERPLPALDLRAVVTNVSRNPG